ncbi:MAG: DUF4426 domain-containing protein [Gammaproteobacteria bacterium]
MRAFLDLSAVLISVIVLAACSPDPAVQVTGSGPAAEPPNASMKDFGDYVIHFNAIATDQLQPEVARAYNITRSKNRAMLNVSIIRKVEGTIGKSVAGSVSATANNLTGQLKNLTLRQVQEGDAVYYIGDVSVASGETLVFNIDATPINETSRFSVRFSRQFFAD